jgi:uncharacterized protein YejL (UPF0352 family)
MKVLSIFLLMIVSGAALSQIEQDIITFDQKQKQINQNGMIVLGSWASTNIVTGLIARSQTTETARYFHEMNALWNSVNFVLAGTSLLQSRREQPFGLTYSLKRQRKLENVFLINSGLDLAYIGSGFYLRHASSDQTGLKSQRLEGYGNSLILQGGFLLFFDGAMYLIHKRHGKQLLPSETKITINTSANGVGVYWNF